MEKRAILQVRGSPVKVGHQGSHDFVLPYSHCCLGADESADCLVGLLTTYFKKVTFFFSGASLSWATKSCSLQNHDDHERAALSNSGKRAAGTAAARESKDESEKFSDVPIVVSQEK